MTRHSFRVTTKAALYNLTKTKVVIVEHLPGEFGLPGGHIEGEETPTEAVIRELQEEIGLTLSSEVLIEKDFWRHPNGKIVLGYEACIDEATQFIIDKSEIRSVQWVDINAIRSKEVSAGTYDRLVLLV